MKNHAYEDNLSYEKHYQNQGYQAIAGCDEVGRGPFAGPVVAAAVIMPEDTVIPRLTDSKKLPKKEHQAFAEQVKETALAYAVAYASVEEIDSLNIKNASQLAMKRAVENLSVPADVLLVDGNETVALPLPQEKITKGDYYSHTISAAAILAKVERDQHMQDLETEFPDYGWRKNAGYLTALHKEALATHGLTRHHRTSWKTYQEYR